MDYVVSSYTPTLAALLRAQRRCTQPFTVQDSKLLVIATDSADRSDLLTLWNVEQEVENVTNIARNAGVTVEVECAPGQAASAKVVPVLDSVQFAHIACHGIQHTTEPLESGFALGNGSLTVRQLMDLDLKSAFFAFLSACEAAKGDEKQPDQTIHLAATVLFIGFKSVVATMWAMNDSDGPSVAKHFYERLLARESITAGDIPYALDDAFAQLRKAGVSLERWATFVYIGA